MGAVQTIDCRAGAGQIAKGADVKSVPFFRDATRCVGSEKRRPTLLQIFGDN
jgi:hypothetical protein